MAVKNATTKVWALTPSFDGLKYSAWPGGDKPSGYITTPRIVQVDLKAIKLSGGVNNKGSWVRLFVYGPGSVSALGTAAGARVYLRDPLGDNAWHEVDNYWHLKTSPTYARNQLLEVCVQIGALGGGMVAGRSLDVKMTVNGVDSNIVVGQFIIEVGKFWFVDAAAADDAHGVADDPSHPFKYPQVWTGSTFTGLCATGGVGPGDTIVYRGGTNHTSQLGYNGRFFRFATTGSWAAGVAGGSVPNGSAGTGYITHYGYPGENAHGLFSGGGGIHGCESSFAATHGKYVQISNFSQELTAGAQSDAGMVYLQSGGDNWLVVGNRLGPWTSTLAGGVRSAAITGQGKNSLIACNECFGIDSTTQEAHGIYMGGQGNTGDAFIAATQNTEVCYNWCHDIPGGSGIQFHWQGTGGADTVYFTGNKIHHNYVENTFKYGINLSQSNVSADVYNNITVNTGLNPIRFECPSGQTLAINVACNTAYGWNARASINDAAVLTEGFASAGAINVRHNIFAAASGRSVTNSWYANNGGSDANLTMDQNIWWDFAGTLTGVPTKDATNGKSVNPNFTNRSLSVPDLTRTAGADLTTTEAVVVTTDFYGIARPQGAHKWIGACEGAGT